MALPVVLLATNLACTNPPPGTSPPGATGVPTAATGSTGDTGPTTTTPGFTARCDPTDNGLRFSCTVTTDPPRPVQLRYAPADGGGPERILASGALTATHTILAYFLQPDTDYAFTAETTAGDADLATGTFHSGVVPDEAVAELDVTGASSVPLIGVNDPCTGLSYAVIFDTATGEVVWYQELDSVGTFGLLNMVQFTEDRTVLGQTNNKIVEVDRTGSVIYQLESGVDYSVLLHHDQFKRDGYYYLLFQQPGNPVLDGIAVFDGAETQVAEWRAQDALSVPYWAEGDWMHTNTVYVDPAGDLYLSSFTQDADLKVVGDWTSPDFGQVVWSMAGVTGSDYGQDWVLDWSKVDGVDGFEDQHDVHLLPDGRMVMLDNAHGRGLVLTLDQATRTGTVDAAYPTSETACGPQGTAAVTATGNVVVACSGDHVREYRPDGTLVWQAVVQCPGFVDAVRFYPLDGW